jgi:glycosyltransferase involved in cell wall biosynthesis
MLDGDPTSEKVSIAMIFSRSHPDCFIGITSWNSEAFLGPCLDQIGKTARGRVRVVVLDNASTDRSAEVASSRGAEVIVKKCDQWQAMNWLLKMSRNRYTLLIHSDVILLHDDWLDLCAAEMPGNVALVAPEDIGCGPYTRPWGKGMPESSFLFFDTRKAMSARKVFWRQRFKMKLPYRAFDFRGDHITYNVPTAFKPKYWWESLPYLRYGLGNFYSLDGQITHYHNWFDRVGLGSEPFDPASKETVPPEGGIPKAYLQISSRRFLDDLTRGALRVPEIGAISTEA